VTSTEQGCPEGAIETGGSCVKTIRAEKNVSCPKGSSNKHGACIEKTSTTVTACPPGATETGKGCEQVETIPATAVYAAPPTPAPTKEVPPPAKKLRSA